MNPWSLHGQYNDKSVHYFSRVCHNFLRGRVKWKDAHGWWNLILSLWHLNGFHPCHFKRTCLVLNQQALLLSMFCKFPFSLYIKFIFNFQFLQVFTMTNSFLLAKQFFSMNHIFSIVCLCSVPALILASFAWQGIGKSIYSADIYSVMHIAWIF